MGLRINLLCILALMVGAFSTGAPAIPISLEGTLALAPDDANDTYAYSFVVTVPSAVTIQSYGYGGSTNAPGGRNVAGNVIPPGGFDPYISVFAGSGPFATFIASNDDGLCPPATLSGGACRDSSLTLNLTAGTYTLVVSAFENMSFAENLGSGTLADGFVRLGNFDEARTANFAVDIIGGEVMPVSGTIVPALAPWIVVLLLGLVLLIGINAMRTQRTRRPKSQELA